MGCAPGDSVVGPGPNSNTRGLETFVGLAANVVVGLILLFLTNLIVSPPIPINLFTVLISAGALGRFTRVKHVGG